jgi:hypothetical protein
LFKHDEVLMVVGDDLEVKGKRREKNNVPK